MEEADGGYAGCAGLETLCGVLCCHSSQGENWDRRGEVASLRKQFGAGARTRRRITCRFSRFRHDSLFEYRGEEDAVWTLAPRGFNFRHRVAGDGDDWQFGTASSSE